MALLSPRRVLTFRSHSPELTEATISDKQEIPELILSQGGNMDVFPEITFSAPDLHQDSIDGERTIDIVVA